LTFFHQKFQKVVPFQSSHKGFSIIGKRKQSKKLKQKTKSKKTKNEKQKNKKRNQIRPPFLKKNKKCP